MVWPLTGEFLCLWIDDESERDFRLVSWEILDLMKAFTFICAVCALSLAAILTSARAEGTNKAAPKPDLSVPASLTEKAPEAFKARFETSKGSFTVEVTRSLAPNGADRFYNLVRTGYFTDVEFFRVISGFMCQFGIHGNPKVTAAWREARIPDEPVKGSNTRGAITFAKAGPNTRTTQLFINLVDNARLDGMGFSPFGKVVEGMDVVDQLHSGYGECAPQGLGPDQGRTQQEGNAYLKKEFPKLDYIKSAAILP